MQQVGSPMGQQGIAFHFPEADPAPQLAPLDGLPRQGIHRPEGPHLAQGGCVRRPHIDWRNRLHGWTWDHAPEMQACEAVCGGLTLVQPIMKLPLHQRRKCPDL